MGQHDNYMDITTSGKEDFAELTRLWEASVRATHNFLKEEDLQEIGAAMPEIYLPAVELLCIRQAGTIRAFIGLSSDTIDMLFVHPDSFGCGYGSRLIEFAIKEKGVKKVDVNEHNTGAMDFYLKKGFRVISRDEYDSGGRHYPILHMSL